MDNEDFFTEEEARVLLAGLAVGMGVAICKQNGPTVQQGLSLAHATVHILLDTYGREKVDKILKDAEDLVRGKLMLQMAKENADHHQEKGWN